MRALIFICSLFFLLPKSWSQQLILDSLNQLLITETDPYERIDLHLGLARANAFAGDQVEGKKNVDLAIELSKKHDWPEALVSAYVFKGVSELNNGAGSSVLYKYIQKAIQLANKIGDHSGLAFANYHLAEYYIFDKNDGKKGLEVLDEALKKIDGSVANKHIGNIYKTQGVAFGILGDMEAELNSYQQALKYFEKAKVTPFLVERIGHKSAIDIDDTKMNIGQVLVYIGIILTDKEKFEEAIIHMNKAKKIYQSLEVAREEAWSLGFLAFVYKRKGDRNQAIINYQKAIKKLEGKGYHFRLISLQLSIGELFYSDENYEAALENFENAKSNCSFLKDTVYTVRTMGWIGKAALQLGDTIKALSVVNEALALNEVLALDGERYKLLEILSEIYEAKGNYAKAIELNRAALVLNKRTNGFIHLQKNYTHLAQLFSKQNQIDSALYYGNLALENGKKHASPEQKISLQKVMVNVYEKKGDFEKALEYQKNHFNLFKKFYDDKSQVVLKNEQVRQDVAGIEAEKKQAETMASLLASRNQLYLVLALGLGFALLMGTYLFRQLRKNKDQLASQNLQLEQLNATRDKFFGIIAHDIRSPIVALDGVGAQMEYYLKKEDTKKLERLAGRVDVTAKRLNGLLDNLLSWALLQQGVIPFHPKSINIKNIGEETFEMFEQNAKAKNISLKLDVDPQQKVFADEAALNTILRNLISNAIKFTPAGGMVSLGTETKGDKIFIKINDTGTGISAEKLTKLFALEKQSEAGTFGEKGTGLGLTLVKELVELNNGSIDVTSVLEQGSSFLVGLPINP